MSELVPHRLNGREDRRVGREVALLNAQARMSLARVQLAADVQAARVHGLAFVGSQALMPRRWFPRSNSSSASLLLRLLVG